MEKAEIDTERKGIDPLGFEVPFLSRTTIISSTRGLVKESGGQHVPRFSRDFSVNRAK